jgi:phosphoglycolate phosphatase
MPGIPRGVNVQAWFGVLRVAVNDLTDATIVFDLDGTLVDTAPDLTNALNDVLTRRGHAAVALETIRGSVGLGARVMIEEALHRAGKTDDVDVMLADFLVHYEENIAAESRPFPGAVAALDALADAGARLAICTNKREYLSLKLLSDLDLRHYFQGVAGRDSFAVSKPDPGHLTQTIARAGGDPARAVMIGDSVVDLRAAKGAGVPSILVSFGYAADCLEGLAPDAVIDHFDDLEVTARRLLGARASAGAGDAAGRRSSPRPPQN